MNTKLTNVALAFRFASLLASLLLTYATRAAENVATTPSAGTPSVLPRPDFHFTGNVGRTYRDSDPGQFPQPVRAPQGAPNIVLILIDDAGFGQFSTFGGGVPSPTMDRLAAEGLRYNRFHTTALCSLTRASLLTGRNHHSVSSGVIQEAATGYDGYTGIIPRAAGTLGTGDLAFPSAFRSVESKPSQLVGMDQTLKMTENNGFTVIDVTPDRMTFTVFMWRPPQPVGEIDTMKPAHVHQVIRKA